MRCIVTSCFYSNNIWTLLIRHSVPTKIPLILIDNKVPLELVLIFPEKIRQHECSCLSPRTFPFGISHNCGVALFESCRETMKKVFVTIQQVRDLSEAIEPWNRVLWLEVDDFNITCPSLIYPINPRIWISLKYKLTDKNNKILFSSNISLETTDELAVGNYTDMTSEFIERIMLKMVEEIMDVYEKGQI